MLIRIWRGVRQRAALIAVADDQPFAPERAVDREANGMATPRIHPRARRASSPSTMSGGGPAGSRSGPSPGTRPLRTPMARRSAPNTRGERNGGSPGVARRVTCTASRCSTFGRVSCGITDGRAAFCPAPLRAPPHARATAEEPPQLPPSADLIPRWRASGGDARAARCESTSSPRRGAARAPV